MTGVQTCALPIYSQHTSRVSVFDRIGTSSLSSSVFDRLGDLVPNRDCLLPHATHISRTSALNRLGAPNRIKENQTPRLRNSVFSRVKANYSLAIERNNGVSKRIEIREKEDVETRSLIPSRMKRITMLDVSVDEVLKAKRRVIVMTNQNDLGNQEADKGEVAYTSSYHITCEEAHDDDSHEDDVHEAPSILEDGGQPTVDELKELNLGTAEEPRPILVSTLLNPLEEEKYFELLSEYKDVFAWTYKEMPGLDPKIAVHNLAIKHGTRPVKQAQRFFRPELVPKIEEELNKLIEAGFIREAKYPTWISSIVPVKKKNGKIRICVDFRNLNNACPKDDFPIPIAELTVDSTTGHEALSFMDGFSGYNQIRMTPTDEELTTFRTLKGNYCYKVMPFGLKNAGAAYQRTMQKIFDDILHKIVECYVDDLVVESKNRGDHFMICAWCSTG